MKKQNFDFLLSKDISVEEIIKIYLTEGLVKSPEIFGLKDFSEKELIKNSFYRAGDDNFCLWEKSYRVCNRKYYINFKLYFVEKKYESNGIDLFGVKFKTFINNYAILYGDLGYIKTIRLYLDGSGCFGSIVINDNLDFRFEKRGVHLKRKFFEFTGLSTDIGESNNFTEKKINTTHAKKTKTTYSFSEAKKKFPRNKAVIELIDLLLRKFPQACH